MRCHERVLDAFLLVLLVDKRLVNVWDYTSTGNCSLHDKCILPAASVEVALYRQAVLCSLP